MKRCFQCGIEKGLMEFHKNRARADGYANRCKLCTREYSQQWREANKEQISECHKQWHQDNKEYKNDYVRQWNVTIKGTWLHFFRRRWYHINSRTTNGACPLLDNKHCAHYLNKGIERRFTREEFKHWCEQRAELIEWMYAEGLRPSLDRKDPDGHYSLDNIRVIPLSENIRLARRAKSTA